MVPAETIIFHCPHCQVRLNVPARLAGVTGPCPKCRESITAPMESEVVPAPVPAAAAVEAPMPAPEGPKIRPEPRQLPERGHAAPISPKRSTADDLLKPRPVAYISRGSSRPSRVFHSLVPATFIAAAGVIVYLLLYFYYPDGPGRRLRVANSPLVVTPRSEQSVVATPSPAPDQAGVAPAPADDAVPSPVPPVVKVLPGITANDVIDAFLKAKDAASRVEMLEPPTSAEELEKTLLRGPLPEVSQVFSDLPRQNSVEGFTDYPYRVSFVVEGRPNTDFAVLVRQRGNQQPRVYLPAFLDLVGGRLSAFTRQPNTLDPARFHVILRPEIGCHEDGIPNPDRKFTLKLLSSNFGKETARAYCSNNSRFREMMEKPDYPIRWGVRVPATITIQWNHKEDPTMPYLELIDINSPDWNP